MLLNKQLPVPIDFHCVEKNTIEVNWDQQLCSYQHSSFVFRRRKDLSNSLSDDRIFTFGWSVPLSGIFWMYIIGWFSTAAVFTLQERRLPRPPSSTASTNMAFSFLSFKWEIKQGSTGLTLASVYSLACLSVEKPCCYLKLPCGVAVFRFSVLACAWYTGMGLFACTLLKWLRNLHECEANTFEIPPFNHISVWKFDIFCIFITNRSANSHIWQTYLKAHPELREI